MPGANFHKYDGVNFAPLYPKDVLDRVKHFEFRESDVLLVNYIKSGKYSLAE